MPVPDVAWAGRDTTALSHEQIYRWVHDGADPGALENARLRHATHGEELRAAARRLESAHAELSSSWRGRDAEAATAHVRTVVARMSGLGDTVTGQAGSLAGVRDALARVQAAVGPPRAPALPALAAPPEGLPTIAGQQDGFAAFQAAQDDERAAQAAYRAYLEETSAAARSAPSAFVVGPGGVAEPGGVGPGSPGSARAGPGDPPPARSGPVRPVVPAGRSGVLARAAGVGDPRAIPAETRVVPGVPATRGGGPPLVTSSRPSVPTPGAPARPVVGAPQGRPSRGIPIAAAGVGDDRGPGRRPGLLGRLVARLTGSPPEPPGRAGRGGAGMGGAGMGGERRRPTRRPGRPVDETPADRLHGAGADDRAVALGHPVDVLQPVPGQGALTGTAASLPAGSGSAASGSAGPVAGGDLLGGGPFGGGPPGTIPGATLPPMLGPMAAWGEPEQAGRSLRHPEYLVELDPVAGSDDGRPGRVAPPVLGAGDPP